MPKETIPSREGENKAVATVSWGRDGGDVQIATLMPDAHEAIAGWTEATRESYAAVAAHHDAGGRADASDAPQFVWTKPGTGWHEFGGFHADLDRWQINALIRTLRRARDAAFGRDE